MASNNKQKLPIPLSFYNSEYLGLSSQNIINLIPTVSEDEAVNAKALLQPSGVSEFSAATVAGVGRGSKEMNGVPYFVLGNSLISIDAKGNRTAHGNIVGTGRVVMATNGIDLVICVPNSLSYAYNRLTLTLTQITDANFQISNSVVYASGFFVFTNSTQDQIFHSNLNEPLAYNALDFNGLPSSDKIISVNENNGQLYVLGEKSSQAYRATGSTEFAFQLVAGSVQSTGLAALHSLVNVGDRNMYVGAANNQMVGIYIQASTSMAQKVSTNCIDLAIQKFTAEEIANSYSFSFSQKGQLITCFTFESDSIPSVTFCFNATASNLTKRPVWFQLQTGLASNSWRINNTITIFGKILCVDNEDTRIGYLDDKVFTEYNNTVTRSCTMKPFAVNQNKVFNGELSAYFEAGVGLTTGQGSDPQVMMTFSDDGGHTFKGPFKRPMGKIGQYGVQTTWNRQGRIPNSRILRLTVNDPVSVSLLSLSAQISKGV